MSIEHGMSNGLCVPSPGIITAKLQNKAGSLEGPHNRQKQPLWAYPGGYEEQERKQEINGLIKVSYYCSFSSHRSINYSRAGAVLSLHGQ